MTTIVTAIQNSIEARGLPFLIHASEGAGAFVTLTVRVRTRDGRESAEHVSFSFPSDPVLLDGMEPALSKMITRANLAQHMGLEVF
jgi:hypothetical protein